MANTTDTTSNRCERCKRKPSDPNARYGWRCAEILGVTERLNRSGDGAFKAYMDGIGESNGKRIDPTKLFPDCAP